MTPDRLDLEASELPVYARERWPQAVERVARKTQAVVPNPVANRLVQVTQKGSTASQRVIWLQRAASAWAQPLQDVAACRRMRPLLPHPGDDLGHLRSPSHGVPAAAEPGR